jgi:hypothetical protein
MTNAPKTRLRELRRNVRRVLGTSSDGVPEANAVLNAARDIGSMLDIATGGEFGIAVYDFRTQKTHPVGNIIDYRSKCQQAWREAQESGNFTAYHERKAELDQKFGR